MPTVTEGKLHGSSGVCIPILGLSFTRISTSHVNNQTCLKIHVLTVHPQKVIKPDL